MTEVALPIWLDSRDLAQRFGQLHHNMLASIDLIISRCPALVDHVRFSTYTVTAGLGGKRRVRHALFDRIGFAMLAMTISTLRCEMVFETLRAYEPQALINQ